MQRFLIICSILISSCAIAQNEPKPVEDYDPICKFWQLNDPDSTQGIPIAGFNQRYIFLTGEPFLANLMTPSNIEGTNTKCETFFNLMKDTEFLYFEIIGRPCLSELTEEEREFKVRYKLTMKNSELDLTLDGTTYTYRQYRNPSRPF
ncbi:MAG: hypothetical protein QNK23_03270 [Crocinitomicaceae bacterium]|nr:hypothetical protein [Crocinitomicaceae bacterium]